MKLKLYVRMLSVCILMTVYSLAGYAQTSAVTGTVFESDGKTPLVGVAVIVKGTSTGVTTGVDGKYSINAGPNDILEFRCLGYNTQEIPVGGQTVINATMIEASEEIGEVVVTALGISREAKSLGYAVTKIDGDDVLAAGTSNWLDALSGQVAGLTFDQASPGPMSSLRVTLRGDQSLNYGSNQALFVIDGVPISNASTETAGGSVYANSDSPVDFGNGAADLNPDDIESISVLKGPAATALYGSRAANGAIVITTKKGRTDRGIGVSFSSMTTFERGMRWPDFQKEYGPGTDMGAEEFSFWDVTAAQSTVGREATRNQSRYAFGEKYDANQTRYIYASRNWKTDEYTPLPWKYADNWFTGLFETGISTKNTVTLDASNGTTSNMRLSVSDTRSQWILPNTPSNSQTVAFSASHKMNKAVTITGNFNYVRRKSDNVPNTGYGVRNPVYQLIWSQSVNDINQSYKAEYFEGRYNPQTQSEGGLVYQHASNPYNPYVTLYEEVNPYDKQRFYGHIKSSVEFTQDLVLDLRAGMDLSSDFTSSQAPYMSGAYTYGFYKEQNSRQYEYNLDFLLRYQRADVDGKLTSSFGIGGNHMRYHFGRMRAQIDKLEVEGIYNLNNAARGTYAKVSAVRRDKSVNSFYGYAQFGWNDFLFLDITGRNDWTSTLGKGNRSYFYPSVSASFLIEEVANFRHNAPWINMLKVRASWANVGNDTDPYVLDEYYAGGTYSGGYLLPTTIADPNLKPENVESWEVGLETRFLNNRISFDAAFYRSSTTNQILSVSVDPMVGANSRKINAGEVMNKGVELTATFTPVKTRDFNWTFSVNWYKNWNKLVKMTDEWDPASPYQTDMTTTIGGRVYIYSYVGQAMGYIYGKDYQRAPKGSYYIDENGNQVDCSGMKLVNASNGYPILDDNPDSRIAKVNPEWNAGMSHTFRYKNWSLGMNFSAQWGGHCFSATHFALAYQGKLTNSLEGRYDGLVVNGVNAVTDAAGNVSYQKNNTITTSAYTYYNTYVYNRDNVYENTFKTSYLKLKKLSLDYSFPAELVRKTGFIEGASIGVFATNVFCWTSFPLFDPETGNMTGTNIYRGIETGAMPMVRQFGFNLKLSF